MVPLLGFTILVILGVVTSENHDLNSQTPYMGKIKPRSVEATTLTPPDPVIENEGMKMLLARLENLCVEKLEYLITDTNTRFQSLENKFLEVHSTVREIVQNNDNLETKVEGLGKEIQVIMDATRNLPSDVEAIKINVSSLINVTRSVVDSSSNLVSKQIFNKGLQELKDLHANSCPKNVTPYEQYPKNCAEVQKYGNTGSGIHIIQPQHAPKAFEVFCDFETSGGDWTVIQRRFNGSQDFYLGWEEYKNGFGNLRGEFWLGLENIHLLTGYDVNELLVEVGNFSEQNRSALYSQIRIGSETEGYSLKILGDYSGNAGDYLRYSVGQKFTTKDMDQDNYKNNCAEFHGGPWWHNSCTYSNLNGEYFERDQIPQDIPLNHGIFWKYHFNNPKSSLKYTKMSVRPKV